MRLGERDAAARLAGHDHGILATALAAKYPQYRDRPFHRVIVLQLGRVTGWTADRPREVDSSSDETPKSGR